MSAVPVRLATSLRDTLGLKRAVETGTYIGDGARRLADVFPEVVTIEIAPHLQKLAAKRLEGTNVRTLVGDSVELLPELSEGPPTFYWLDGHWSGGDTAAPTSSAPYSASSRC